MPVFAAQFVIGPSGIVDTSDAAAMRTALGLGSAALSESTAFALSSHTQAPQTIAGATTTGQVLISLTDGTFTAARLTAGSNITLTHGSGSLVIAAVSGGSVSGIQTKLFDAPAARWRGVTANVPEPDLTSVAGMTSGSYGLSFDSSTTETAQLEVGHLPTDTAWSSASVAIALSGHAFSATSGTCQWVLAHKLYTTGGWTGAFTGFATISATLPGNTGSAYTGSYIATAASLGWTGGQMLELQLTRRTTGAATHAADSIFHGITAFRVEA